MEYNKPMNSFAGSLGRLLAGWRHCVPKFSQRSVAPYGSVSCLNMTPNLWHKISKNIVHNRKKIVILCLCSFAAMMTINLVRWFGVNNGFTVLLSILFAYIFFVSVSLIVPWSWFRKISSTKPRDNVVAKTEYVVGTTIDWCFSIILTLWYFAVFVMFFIAVFANVGS
jgi:hypothetical protein